MLIQIKIEFELTKLNKKVNIFFYIAKKHGVGMCHNEKEDINL